MLSRVANSQDMKFQQVLLKMMHFHTAPMPTTPDTMLDTLRLKIYFMFFSCPGQLNR